MSKSKILAVFLFFSVSVYSQTIGQVTVKTWADNRKAAFSFTFDDGYKSQYDYALPVLDSFGFKATFYVIAGSLTEDSQPLNWRYGTWGEFRQMAYEGHEIGSHTMTHPHLPNLPAGDISTPNTIYYELYQSKNLIEQKISGITVTTLAYPYIEYNGTVQNIAQQYYEASREGGDIPNSSTITGIKWQNLNSYTIQFDLPRNSVSDDDDELQQFETSMQNDVINNKKWGMLFAHEVLPFSQIPQAVAAGYWYPMSTEWLTALCQWMKTKSDNNELWITTVANITKYIKERENFTSSVIASTDSRIELNVTDNLDDSIFNYPLTVDIQVPSGWQDVKIMQGTDTTSAVAFISGGNTFVRTNVVPDAGNVILTNASSLFALSGKVTYDNTSSTPLKNVTLEIKDVNNIHQTTVTDSLGNYSFTNLPVGSYTLTVSKTGNWGGVNAADALIDLKYFTNSVTFDQLQIAAGDVDNNGIINAADALLMVRRYAGLISSFTISDWLFDSMNSAIIISNQDVIKNIKGIAAGDVSKSYIP